MPILDDNGRAAVLMLACMAAFTVNDTFMKLLGAEFPLFQVMFLRGLVIIVVFLLVARRMGLLRVRVMPGDGWKLALRTFAEAASAALFLSALFNMPLANATAIIQLVPLTVTLGAALFLGEAVGWRRMLAIVAGFAGVLLIVQPGTDGFDRWSVLALLSVLFFTLRELVTRRMSGGISTLVVATAGAAGVTVVGAAGSLAGPWVPMTAQAWIWLSGAILSVGLAYLLSVVAVRIGDMGFVAPFRYSGLLWALILGWAVFGDWPDMVTLVGAAIVVGAGLFTFARERRVARQPVATESDPRL